MLRKHPRVFVSFSVAVLFLTQGMSGSNVLSQPYFPRARRARDVARGADGDGEWEAIASVIHCLLTEEICGEIFRFSFLLKEKIVFSGSL